MTPAPTQVLLIEDDKADYQLFKRCVSRMRGEFELHWAESLQAGITALEAAHFDVVLTDLSLPDSRGLETVEAIRQRDRAVAIVVLTTMDDSAMEIEALSVGAQDYLLKNEAAPHALERAIHHAVQRQQNLVEFKSLLAEVNASRELLAEQKLLLQRKNRRLKKLYKTAHSFVDNVSHEFRTPLTVIKDYVTLVRDGIVGEVNDEQVRMLDIASVRADDLNNMVDDMLDVSKLEAGLLGAWRRDCELADIVQSVAPMLEKKAEVKNIAFETAVPDGLPKVYCDGEKVGRVIINLVTNAIKFCGDPGMVRLWAKHAPESSELVVGVTDNGHGIDEEGVAEIFRRFHQLSGSLKSSTKGFGLGLNIAKELVDLNFGDLRVDSQIDKGSTFTFTIPIADPAEVMRRYLERIERMRYGSPVMSLLTATIDRGTSLGDSEDMDAFFNYLLRRNDLLFRIDQWTWQLALPVAKSEVELYIERATKELKKTNRNRPYGPLPDFQMRHDGTWRVAEHPDAILAQFQHPADKLHASCQGAINE